MKRFLIEVGKNFLGAAVADAFAPPGMSGVFRTTFDAVVGAGISLGVDAAWPVLRAGAQAVGTTTVSFPRPLTPAEELRYLRIALNARGPSKAMLV
jgi:hypothetical protein